MSMEGFGRFDVHTSKSCMSCLGMQPMSEAVIRQMLSVDVDTLKRSCAES